MASLTLQCRDTETQGRDAILRGINNEMDGWHLLSFSAENPEQIAEMQSLEESEMRRVIIKSNA
jgi:hypothetical protein